MGNEENAANLLKIEIGQTDLSNHWFNEHVGIMGEVYMKSIVNKQEGRRGLLDINKPLCGYQLTSMPWK